MPEPYWADETVTLHLGKCEEVLPSLPAESVDAIVTDPPAAIAFMGRSWDSDRGGRDKWVAWLAGCMEAAARVLKPGGHLLVWSLPRTSHWTALALEDAGLEIRDCILHLFGSGYPKSRDVSKAIDEIQRGGMVRAKLLHFAEERGIGGRWLEERGVASAASFTDWTTGGHVPSDRNWQIVKIALEVTDEEEAAFERAVIGRGRGKGTRATIGAIGIGVEDYDITAPATEDAARWGGWGTALKPGQEMWWLARKPLKGTVAANVLEYGTGALNIDACKVGTEQRVNNPGGMGSLQNVSRVEHGYRQHVVMPSGKPSEVTGRWPANIVLTHSAACDEAAGCAPDCPVAELDRQSGVLTSGANPARRSADKFRDAYGEFAGQQECVVHRGADSGGASRFYPVFRYQAKAPASERPRLEDGTAHETVKPLGFIQWAVRLVTRPGGTVLDLFAGSGPVAEACIIEGFRCVLIEQDPKSCELIKTRLSKPIQPVMFGMEAS